MTNENETNKRPMVRCTFEITQKEADKLRDLLCEPKVSTAAAQVVRKALKEAK